MSCATHHLDGGVQAEVVLLDAAGNLLMNYPAEKHRQ